MSRTHVVKYVLVGMMISVLTACTSGPSTTTSGSSAPSAATGASDALQACLGRIPADASAGMRMIAEDSCRRNEAWREEVVGTATAKSGDRPASGTVGDTLEACLARIPKDATAGQRLLAEGSCRRDHAGQR